MLERFIQHLRTDDPGQEAPAATRERLKGRFAPGSTRRMTLLGMLVGAVVGDLQPAENDAVVYVSAFGEGRALEDFLVSFPAASPTLFQTSIHPSGVQQALIGRQRSVRELFPHAGGGQLPVQGLLTAMLSPAPRAVLVGGEERGTWLVDAKAVSDRTFAYALALTRDPGLHPLGRLTISSVIDRNYPCFSGITGKMPVPPGDLSEPTGKTRPSPEATAGRSPVPRGMGVPPMSGSVTEPATDLTIEAAEATLSHAAWFELLHGRHEFDGPAAEGWRLQLVWM